MRPCVKTIILSLFIIVLTSTTALSADISRGRITLSYDENQWKLDTKKLSENEILINREDALIDIQILKDVATIPSEITAWRVFVKKHFGINPENIHETEFKGRKGIVFDNVLTIDGTKIYQQCILISEAGDVFAIAGSSKQKDPLSDKNISGAIDKIKISPR